jgi:HlyD family secretion protein
VVVWEGDAVLKVPTSSLFPRGEDWAVFAADGDRARLRLLEVGRRNGSLAEAVSGLREGSRVTRRDS